MDNNEKAFESYTETEVFRYCWTEIPVWSVLDDWLERNIQSDFKVRRAKTPGRVVIETGDVFLHVRADMEPSCKPSTSKRFEVITEEKKGDLRQRVEGYGYNPFPVKEEEGCCCQS